MSIFRFKRFEVVNEKSAMKVNTDGVILGAAMTILPGDKNVLDVGTGTGTIALMAAQRLSVLHDAGTAANDVETGQFSVTAVEMDRASAEEAAANFYSSPWADKLHICNTAFQEYTVGEECFDLICSNPPYFEASLKAPDYRRSHARHSDMLSYRELIDFSAGHLTETGRLSMILPAEQEQDVLRYARMNGLFPSRLVYIRTVPRKTFSRIIVELSHFRNDSHIKEPLSIHNADGEYSSDYKSLMSDFLIIFQ